jgi:aspartate-semialdehyde dehydrogenase
MGVDIAFFDASDAVSKEWVPQAAEAGAWVIDNSATYRMEQDIPLVVPEINGAGVEKRAMQGASALKARERIFAGPNCSTVQMVMALKPLLDRYGLKRVVVSTYQSTSGAGTAAVDELKDQAHGVLNSKVSGRPSEPSRSASAPKAFPHQIAFNCIPHIGGFKDDGYTSEEKKLMAETRKILDLPSLSITATAIRVPTFSCHAESVNVEFLRPFELKDVRSALASQPGVILQDDPAHHLYPMGWAGESRDFEAVESGTGRDAVYVGRLRRDPSVENGLNLWIVSDNLRKGAALNAIQIGETIIRSQG